MTKVNEPGAVWTNITILLAFGSKSITLEIKWRNNDIRTNGSFTKFPFVRNETSLSSNSSLSPSWKVVLFWNIVRIALRSLGSVFGRPNSRVYDRKREHCAFRIKWFPREKGKGERNRQTTRYTFVLVDRIYNNTVSKIQCIFPLPLIYFVWRPGRHGPRFITICQLVYFRESLESVIAYSNNIRTDRKRLNFSFYLILFLILEARMRKSLKRKFASPALLSHTSTSTRKDSQPFRQSQTQTHSCVAKL